MAKFYIQSGEMKSIIIANNYIEALYFSIKRIFKEYIETGEFKNNGGNFFISEKGFLPHKSDFNCFLDFPNSFDEMVLAIVSINELKDKAIKRHQKEYKKFNEIDWNFVLKENYDLFLDVRCIYEIFDKKENTSLVEKYDKWKNSNGF